MTHHDSETCAWTTQRLDDFVDAELATDEQRRVETHLEECPRCRADEASLRALLAEVTALPRSIEPDRDLWPEIAGRLEPATVRPTSPAIWRAPWWQQVAAALAFAALGAGGAMVWGASSPGSDPDGAAMAAVAPTDRGLAAGVVPASASRVAFEEAEIEYLRAKEALWVAVYAHRDELSPLQLELVESNLTVIDGAVRQLRDALEKDPEDTQLQKMLLANHRRGLDLLWDLVRSDHA